MDSDSREITPAEGLNGASPEPEHHHPVPSALVRLYGLIAVLLVLLPEWMADLSQMSRNVRIKAHGEVDQERLSLTLRRRLAARRRRELKTRGPLAHPPQVQLQPIAPAASLPRQAWPGAVARAALLVAVGAGLMWGASQLRPGLGPRSGGLLPRSLGPGGGGQAPSAPVPAGQLRLEASEPSWLEVRSLEGKTLYAAILKGRVQIPLGRGLKVLAGRPDLVRASQGSQAPQALGPIDRITWVVFEPSASNTDPHP